MNEAFPETVLVNQKPYFRSPIELQVAEYDVRHALVIGSCFSEGAATRIHLAFPHAKSDHILYNFAGQLPDAPPRPINEYAFQVIILPLRTVMPETMFMGVKYDDAEGFQRCFNHSCEVLRQLLDGALRYHREHGLTTFLTNFLCPQANSMGKLLPYNDLRNPAYYVRQINDLIAEFAQANTNVYLVNVDEIAASVGRRNLQDDIIAMNSHGGYISDWDWHNDQSRLHPPKPMVETHDLKPEEFLQCLWFEIRAMYRTLQQQDSVKIVIFDLDDTVWRGVIAEEGIENPALIEGWPLGVIEAINMLWRRGVLLAIASRNDEARIRELWPHTVGNRFPLENFACIKINWSPKADNVAAILRETNLLARNAVFIDDNPVERENVRTAHPGLRTLGEDLYAVRRILMWAPEMQVASVTAEAGRRTEMIKAQVEREKSRETMPRAEFLKSLEVRVLAISIDSPDHPRFARALELVNKSNQFNTTGERWAREAMVGFLQAGGRMETFEVVDKFTHYGLVGAALIEANLIRQYVMSCRVLGLDAEIGFLRNICLDLLEKNDVVKGRIIETDANILCRDLFARLGFEQAGDSWRLKAMTIEEPEHLRAD